MRLTTVEQDTDEREVQRLQQIIRDRRAAFEAATVGTAAYQSALAAVLEATVELVNHEAGIPVQRMGVYSARTAEIVRRIGLITASIVAAVAALTLTPWLSTWELQISAGSVRQTRWRYRRRSQRRGADRVRSVPAGHVHNPRPARLAAHGSAQRVSQVYPPRRLQAAQGDRNPDPAAGGPRAHNVHAFGCRRSGAQRGEPIGAHRAGPTVRQATAGHGRALRRVIP